jgi:hypothetical protein
VFTVRRNAMAGLKIITALAGRIGLTIRVTRRMPLLGVRRLA